MIYLNFEDLAYEEPLDDRKLYAYLLERMDQKQRYYVFLDEIQRVDAFEKVVDSLYVKENVDLYITGSNAYLLSSDLATLLAGRYVEIKVLPLSFCEFCEARGNTSDVAFSEYLQMGGFPYVAVRAYKDETFDTYLEGIYNTVIVKDIEERQARREKKLSGRKVADIGLLKNIARFLASVIGSPISVKRVADYLASNGRKVSQNTVSDYMDALCESFVFYEAQRFDIAGKQLLRTNKKMYLVDLGLRSHILPKQNYDLGYSLENIVYFELLRRHYRVNIGKLGDQEVDFVAQKGGEITYFQVTADMTAEATFTREMRPLQLIRDNYEKIILTLDPYTMGNYNGIQVRNAKDWFMEA